ncbi:MAG TPA: glycosyltransferase [Opitutales bacterium]|nr:glycosyltransferase [Opitutales bacterium]
MKSETVHLLLGADSAYFEGLRASVLTALISMKGERPCRVTVLDCGLTSEQIERLKKEFDLVAARRSSATDMSFIVPSLEQLRDLPGFGAQKSLAAYARILAPELLPDSEVIWIDADFIVLEDLSQITSQVDRACLVGGVVDSKIRTIENDPATVREGVRDRRYLNSGLLWMNLEQLRAENFPAEALRFMEANKERLIYADQGPINALTQDRRCYLPESLNRQIFETTALGDILSWIGQGNLHFAGRIKPWLNTSRPDLLAQVVVFHRLLDKLGLGAGESRFQMLKNPPSKQRALYSFWIARLRRNKRKIKRAKLLLDTLAQEDLLSERIDDLFCSRDSGNF